MTIPPKPKFEKKHHHVVPQFWQKRFAATDKEGPYYLNVATGHRHQAQGPGVKMSEEYANIVFDKWFRPTDALEDMYSRLEGKFATGLDRLSSSGIIDSDTRIDIAMLMAVQACRYPEFFSTRLEMAKLFAIALVDYRSCANEHALSRALQATGLLPGAQITASDFALLGSATGLQLEAELARILTFQGYEADFNPSLILAAAHHVACHLLGLEWTALSAPKPTFILSDRPVPSPTGNGFSIGLTARYGLMLRYPTGSVTDATIHPRPATHVEIDAINKEVRSRAKVWICGPTDAVHQM